MAKNYEVGEKYYLPVKVEEVVNTNYGVKISFEDGAGEDTTRICEFPDVLFTAEEVAENVDTIARSTLDEYSEKAQRKIEALTKQLEEANETIKAFSESEDIVRTNFDAKVDENKELKSRNAELEALLNEVMATRDEAIKQNNELIADRNNWKEAAQRYHDSAKVADAAADNLRKENGELKAKVTELSVENENLKSDCNDWKDTANERLNAVQTLSEERNKVMAGVDELKNTLVDRTIDVQHLTEENAKLKADLDQRNKDFDAMKKDRDNLLEDNKRTTAYYMEANRTATEAAEANDDLKAKIADLRSQVGKYTADIQDMAAEIHFLKEERDLKAKLAQEWHDNAHSTAKGLDELKGRYDELDSVNKEQAEKIRKLDAHNVYLKGLLSAKKKMRIVLNNGNMYDVEVGDKVHPVYDMNNNLFFVKTEGGTVTSFLIGKEPGNIAGWYFV